MIAAGETETLRIGLRALAAFGRAAPLDIVGFAGLTGMSPTAGETLLAVFESHGYARRVPGGSIFVLTRLGLDLLGDASAAGRLVSEAIEPITACSQMLGLPITLGLPSGDELLSCVVAGDADGLPRPGERLPMMREVAKLAARGRGNEYVVSKIGLLVQLAIPVPLSDDISALLAVHGNAADLADSLTSLLPVMRKLASELAGGRRNGLSLKIGSDFPLSSRVH